MEVGEYTLGIYVLNHFQFDLEISNLPHRQKCSHDPDSKICSRL